MPSGSVASSLPGSCRIGQPSGTVKAKRYLPLAELTVDLTKAQGFEQQFTTDGKTYSLILKDTTDPCLFVFSTNQIGIIFQGYPIDWGVQPVAKSPAK